MITNDLETSEYGHDHLQKKDAAMTVYRKQDVTM